jgi:hypothetical protein
MVNDPLGVVGQVLAGKFRVERLLGEGGFGVVYAGKHLVLDAPIAIKFVKIDGFATDPAGAAEEYLREARILFSLSHPAIVRMYDVGALQRGPLPEPWVVLELLTGPTLDQEIAQRRAQGRHFSAAELGQIFDPILDGLAFAHGRGILHRDLKPSNLALSRADTGRLEPKLLDFGTARSQLAAFQSSVGKTGFTPLYGAPEQWDPSIAPPSPATDVYAVALSLLEAATLQRPHSSADSLPAIMRAVLAGTGRPSLAQARPDLPPALDGVLQRAMAVHPSQRFRDAGELRGALAAALSNTSPGASTVMPPVQPAPAPLMHAGRTTGPFVTAPAAQPSSTGPLALAASLVLLAVVLAGIGVGGFFVWQSTGASSASSGGPTQGGGPAVKAVLSPPQIQDAERLDLQDVTAALNQSQPALVSCAERKSFTGTMRLDVKVSGSGKITAVKCITIYGTSSKQPRPILDQSAFGFCECAKSEAQKWKLKPPKKIVEMGSLPMMGEGVEDEANETDIDVRYSRANPK